MNALPEVIYDGSFVGLLTAFGPFLHDKGEPFAFRAEGEQATQSLFGGFRAGADRGIADGVLRALQEAGGFQSRRTLLLAFLSELADIELALFRYVRLTLRQSRNVDAWCSRECVRRVTEAAGKVTREVHRFHGLLRFSRLADGSFYAPFEPDHNVLVPVARHFCTRLHDERWVIHDRRRHCAVLWDGSELRPVSLDSPEGQQDWEDCLAAEEGFYRDCWRRFTRHIAVANRRNPRLQRAFMPRRYWKYLTEMTD